MKIENCILKSYLDLPGDNELNEHQMGSIIATELI